jgi:zinc transport system permease protein
MPNCFVVRRAIAGQFVEDLKQMMLYSSYLGMIFTIVGLWLSYSWDMTSGATIILVSGTTYLGTLVFKACSKRLKL